VRSVHTLPPSPPPLKPLSNVEDAQDILATPPAKRSVWDYLKLLALLSDTGYKLGDNVEFLSTYVIGFSSEKSRPTNAHF
jgi:hypothetical protein